MKARALSLSVYRWEYDCTNNGISSRFNDILVPCAHGPRDYDTDNPPENLCVVRSQRIGGALALRLVPAAAEKAGKWTMAGGNYATTSDSRWGEMLAAEYGMEYRFNDCLPIHDRIEDYK